MKKWHIVITRSLSYSLLTLAGYLASAQIAEPESALGGSPATKDIGNHVLIRAALQNSAWFKETYVIVDYASPYALQINQGVIQSLRWGEEDTVMQILAPGFRLDVPRAGVIAEKGNRTSDLTARYDNELEQVEVVAIVGWPVLKDFHLSLNLEEETLSLGATADNQVSEIQASVDVVIEGLQIIDDTLFFPLLYQENDVGFAKFNTAGYHTLVNSRDLASTAIVNDLNIRFDDSIDLPITGRVALFPKDLAALEQSRYETELETENQVRQQVEQQDVEMPDEFLANDPDLPNGQWLLTTGLSLLRGYKIDLNPTENYIAFTYLGQSKYSDADHVFYQAASNRDLARLQSYLGENPQDHNVEEAVNLALELAFDAGTDVESLMDLLQFGIDASQERRRFLYLVQIAAGSYSGMGCEKRRNFVVQAAEKAMDYVSFSQTPRFRQQTQLMLGDCYLAQNDNENAWRYFLSAAFNGDPQLDGVVRHELGRAYEAQGRIRRAFSNFSRSLEKPLPAELSESANAALARLTPQLAEDDPLLDGIQ